MPRTTTLLMMVVLVIGSVSAFPVAAAAQSDAPVASAIGGHTHAQVDENASENASNVTPGERLTAVVGVGQAEFEGEVEQRAYGIAYAKANTDGAKAAVVAERLSDVEGRLAELEQEREELEAAHENGEIGDGEFQARMTELAARTETVEQLANASEARAGELPADVLEANGVNVSAIQKLKQHAEELSGDRVAEIARSIAGPDVGQSVSQGPPEDVGVPSPDQARDGARGGDDGSEASDAGDGQAAIDRAAEQVDAAQLRLEEVEQRVNDSDAGENATDAVASAREELEQAQEALEDARAAMESGDDEAAAAHVEDAMNHAEQAESHLQDALDAVQTAGSDDGDADPATETGGDGSDGGYP